MVGAHILIWTAIAFGTTFVTAFSARLTALAWGGPVTVFRPLCTAAFSTLTPVATFVTLWIARRTFWTLLVARYVLSVD